MTIFHDCLLERELKYWMRPEAHRFLRRDWRRFLRPLRKEDPLYKLYERVERKYSSDQARVPAGSREGGQWTSDGSATSFQTIFNRAKRIAASGNATYRQCLESCYQILERFSHPRSDRNTFDFHKCMNACLGR